MDSSEKLQYQEKEELAPIAKEILDKYNHNHIVHAIGYGSGFHRQKGYDKKDQPMLDMIFVVDDVKAWHEANILKNPDDYSYYQNPPEKIHKKNKWAAGVYYNQHIPFESEEDKFGKCDIKYGVISKEDYLKDLRKWEKGMYSAGRAHKPFALLKEDTEIIATVEKNREHAVRSSLLMLPTRFTIKDLFYTVCGLSYIGDKRMETGLESKDKVKNIVDKNLARLIDDYQLVIDKLIKNGVITRTTENNFEQSKEKDNTKELLASIPQLIRQKINLVLKKERIFKNSANFNFFQDELISKFLSCQIALDTNKTEIDQRTITKLLKENPKEISTIIRKGFKEINKMQNWQTLGNVPAAGKRSVRYLYEKRGKNGGKKTDNTKKGFPEHLVSIVTDYVIEKGINETSSIKGIRQTILEAIQLTFKQRNKKLGIGKYVLKWGLEKLLPND